MAADDLDIDLEGIVKEYQNSGGGLAVAGRVLYEHAMPFVRRHIGDAVGFVAFKGASQLPVQDTTALKASATIGAATNIGLAMAANVADFRAAGNRARQSMKALVQEVEPHLMDEFDKKPSIGKLMRSKNEVIATKRSRVLEGARFDLYSAVTGLAARVPDVVDVMAARHQEIEAAYKGLGKNEIAMAKKDAEQAGVEITDAKLDEIHNNVAERLDDLSPAQLVREHDKLREVERDQKKRKRDSGRPEFERNRGGSLSSAFSDFKERRQGAEDNLTGRYDEHIYNVADADIFGSGPKQVFGGLTRSVVPIMQGEVKKQAKDAMDKVCAYDMIQSLHEQGQDGGDLTRALNASNDEVSPLSEVIYDVFRQHQEDVGGKPINERFGYRQELQDACDTIANEILNKGASPMILVDLVGNRKVLSEKMKVTAAEDLESTLNMARATAEHDPSLDPEEYISQTAFATKEDFVEVFSGLKGKEQALLGSLFPINVLTDVAGLSLEDAKDLHEKAALDFVENTLDVAIDIAQMTPEEQRHGGLTKEESEMFQELATLVDDQGREKVIDALRDGELHDELTDALRNAKGYWQDRVRSGGRGNIERADADDGKEKGDRDKSSFVSRLSNSISQESQREGP